MLTTRRVTGPASAAAAAAGPAEPARTPRIPPRLIASILASAGEAARGPTLNLGALEYFEIERHIEWDRIKSKLQEDPLIAFYFAPLDLDNSRLTGREKFQRLFEAMTAELGIPESIQGLDRFSVDCYLRLSDAANVSLERAWGQMRDTLIRVDAAIAALPGPDARAAEIRAWLNDPANSAVLGAVQSLCLYNCDLLVIPKEIKKFPNIHTLFVAGNKIKGIGSRQLDGLARLASLSLSGNQLESLPAGLLQGLDNLQQIFLDHNQLKCLPAGLFRGLNSLKEIYLHSNKLESLLPDLFRGLNSLQKIDLSRNQLENLLPGLFRGLNSLQEIYLGYNKLKRLLPGLLRGFASLQKILLNDNELKSLPAELFQGHVNLQEIFLARNLLTCLPEVLFRGHANLLKIDLNANLIKSLPPGLFRGLDNLKCVSLAGNQLEDLLEDSIQDLILLQALNFDYSLSDLACCAARSKSLSAGMSSLSVDHLQW